MASKYTLQDSVTAGNTPPSGRIAPEIAKCLKTLNSMKAELGTWRKVSAAIMRDGPRPPWNSGYLFKVAKGQSPPSKDLLKDLGFYRRHSPPNGFRVSGSRQVGNEMIRLLQANPDHSNGVSRVILSLMRQVKWE